MTLAGPQPAGTHHRRPPPQSISVLAAANELKHRRDAREKMIPFITYTMPKYKPEPVHDLIGAKLDAVIKGEIKRLMIFAPPQHGKSELVSVRLPALWLAITRVSPIVSRTESIPSAITQQPVFVPLSTQSHPFAPKPIIQ